MELAGQYRKQEPAEQATAYRRKSRGRWYADNRRYGGQGGVLDWQARKSLIVEITAAPLAEIERLLKMPPPVLPRRRTQRSRNGHQLPNRDFPDGEKMPPPGDVGSEWLAMVRADVRMLGETKALASPESLPGYSALRKR